MFKNRQKQSMLLEVRYFWVSFRKKEGRCLEVYIRMAYKMLVNVLFLYLGRSYMA